MQKKQLIKIGNGKTGKITKAIALAILLGSIGSTTAMAGNITDEYYHFEVQDTYAHVTNTRSKQDATSAYINHYGNSPVYVEVCSRGVNYTAGSGRYYVANGRTQYLSNYVYENGQRDCYLRIYSTTSARTALYGVWSPDSI